MERRMRYGEELAVRLAPPTASKAAAPPEPGCSHKEELEEEVESLLHWQPEGRCALG